MNFFNLHSIFRKCLVKLKTRKKYFFVLLLLVIGLVYIDFDVDNPIPPNWKIGTAKVRLPPNTKLVLLWSTIFLNENFKTWGLYSDTLNNCPHKCEFTNDKSLFHFSDAIIYHGFPEGYGLRTGLKLYPLPSVPNRNPAQIWIYLTREPPSTFYSLYDSFEDQGVFNWTMTYRRDSDIFYPYHVTEPIKYHHNQSDSIDLTSKISLAAGMISQCLRPSGRDAYVEELRKYIQVDMFGSCYSDKRIDCRGDCYEQFGKKYKFWLAFENSLCADYATEKFSKPLLYGMVPVYLGHPSAPPNAPPESYIHVKDFESPKALAKYLVYLDENEDEYLAYFKWKNDFQVRRGKVLEDESWCRLCTKLHLAKNEPNKNYPSISNWLLRNNTKESVCVEPHFQFS